MGYKSKKKMNFGGYQTQLLKKQKAYYKKFKKILPTTKVVRYFQLENKIDAMIDAQLALELPLLQ